MQLFVVVLRFCVFLFFPENFDPVAIAEKLRSVAGKLNDDMMFKAVLNDFKKAAAQEVGDIHAQCEFMICWHAVTHSDGYPVC